MDQENSATEHPDFADSNKKLFEQSADLKKKTTEINQRLQELKSQGEELLGKDSSASDPSNSEGSQE